MNVNPYQSAPRPFWQQYFILLVGDTFIVLAGALLLRDLRQVSNLYFWSSIIFLIVAVIPIVTEVGGSAKIVGKALKDGGKAREMLQEKQAIYNQGARTTYVFGLAGLTAFILSFITLL
jgi:hypothetical protein